MRPAISSFKKFVDRWFISNKHAAWLFNDNGRPRRHALNTF